MNSKIVHLLRGTSFSEMFRFNKDLDKLYFRSTIGCIDGTYDLIFLESMSDSLNILRSRGYLESQIYRFIEVRCYEYILNGYLEFLNFLEGVDFSYDNLEKRFFREPIAEQLQLGYLPKFRRDSNSLNRTRGIRNEMIESVRSDISFIQSDLYYLLSKLSLSSSFWDYFDISFGRIIFTGDNTKSDSLWRAMRGKLNLHILAVHFSKRKKY